MNYHNTNNEQGTLLFESETKAHSLERKILEIFQKYPNTKFTAREIQKKLNEERLLTSVRRSISNLADPLKWDKLIKTSEMKPGLYKKVYTWILKPAV
jgi:hypothetical protein